jgi:hypothetical protein
MPKLKKLTDKAKKPRGQRAIPDIALPAPEVSKKPTTREEQLAQSIEKLKSGELTVKELGMDLGMTDKMIKFCEYYTSNEVQANATEAYSRAYGENNRITARGGGFRLLHDQRVTILINAMLDTSGFTEEAAKKALGFLVDQHVDFRAKHSAARTVLELKGLLKSKQELTVRHKYELFENKSFEELLALKQQLLEGNTIDIPYEETDSKERTE